MADELDNALGGARYCFEFMMLATSPGNIKIIALLSVIVTAGMHDR